VLILLGAWVWRAPFVGLADTGDWDRYLCPAGLASDPPDLFWGQVPTQLVDAGRCPWFYRSSHVIVLVGARVVNLASGGGAITLRSLSLMYGVAAAIGFGALAQQLTLACRRPLIVLGAGIGVVVAFADVTFSSYLGSAYAEAFVFTATPLLLALTVRVTRGPARWWTWLLLAVVVVAITTSKPAMAAMALIVVAAVALSRRVTTRRFRLLVAASALGALALAFFDVTLFAEGTYDVANHTNFVFTTLLAEVDDPETTLVDLGLSREAAAELADYTGVGYWDLEGSPILASSYDDFLAEVSRIEVVRFVAGHPAIQWRMMQRAVEAIPESRVEFLSNFAEPRDELLADRPEPMRALVGPIVDLWWLLLPGAWLAVVACGLRLLWRHRQQPLAAIAVIAASAALATTVLSVGDGYVDLERHAVIGAWFTAVLVFGALGALVGAGVEQVASRTPSAGKPEAR
jgi:hypothetical protein